MSPSRPGALFLFVVVVVGLTVAATSARGQWIEPPLAPVVSPVAEEEPPPESSLLGFVADVARAIEARARHEGVSGPVRLTVEPSRGTDADKVRSAFSPRIRKRLREGGVLVPADEAPLSCKIIVSEDGGFVWATALLEGAALTGPAAVAESWPVDRELEATLGAVVKPAQTRFVLERLGSVPAGVLDVTLVDVDGDGVDEVALLGIDGLRLYRAGAQRLERVGSVVPLPGGKRWPRVPAGWLARLQGGRLWAVTSAGHSLLYDPKRQRVETGPPGLVPMRGALGPEGAPLCGGWRSGSPLITLPLVTLAGRAVRTRGLPSRVRDILSVPGQAADGGTWIYVDDQGQLTAQQSGAAPTSLAGERVGDRLVLADLDSDGSAELVTTSAALPGDADHLVLRRLAADGASSSVVFRSPLSGGSIAAAAAGRLDFGGDRGRMDVILIEEVGDEALAWRLRYAP